MKSNDTAPCDLSIIIVNWNSAAYLKSCLQSVQRHPPECRYEVLVIDNASHDGSADLIAEHFSWVHFVQSEVNLGFAEANNLCARQAHGEALLFLNPDTEVLKNAMSQLLAVLNHSRDTGIVGARLLNSDMSLQTSCIQRFPSALNQLLDSDLLRRIFPRASLWGTRPLYDDRAQSANVEMISGACLMIKRSVFEAVCGFSTDYFMYAEDTDLCFKVQRFGSTCRYVTGAHVVHHGAGSSAFTAQSDFSTILMRESLFTFLRLRKGKMAAIRYRLAILILALLRTSLLSLAALVPAPMRYRKRLKAALHKWACILRWSFGLEQWARTLKYS